MLVFSYSGSTSSKTGAYSVPSNPATTSVTVSTSDKRCKSSYKEPVGIKSSSVASLLNPASLAVNKLLILAMSDFFAITLNED